MKERQSDNMCELLPKILANSLISRFREDFMDEVVGQRVCFLRMDYPSASNAQNS